MGQTQKKKKRGCACEYRTYAYARLTYLHVYTQLKGFTDCIKLVKLYFILPSLVITYYLFFTMYITEI